MGISVGAIVRARRVAPVAAVALGVLTLGFCLAAVPLNGVIHQNGPGGPVADWLSTATVVLPVAVVGVLLAARRPRNPIGWILLAILLLGLNPLGQYAVLDYRMHHGTLTLGWVAVVFGSDWPMFLVLIAILLWVFPDGRLPPGRLRPVSVALVGAGLLVGLVGLAPGIVAVAGHGVHVEASGNLSAPSRAWAIAGYMTIIAVLASWLGWLVVQVPRYRRSSGERRQQLKWLYSGATAFLALLCISLFVVPLALGDSPGVGIYGGCPVLVTARAYAMPASRDTSGLAVTSSHPGPDATWFDSTPTSSLCRRRRSLDTALVDVLRTQVATAPTTVSAATDSASADTSAA